MSEAAVLPKTWASYAFAGRTALVTGAASGIGQAAALRFAANRAHVVLADIDEAGGQAVVARIQADGGAASFVRTDVSRAEQVEAMAAAAIAATGRIDYFFNNAGVEGAMALTEDYPEAVWDRVIAVNLKGLWLGLKAVLPRMVKQGFGSIVNTASVGGLTGVAMDSAYTAAKHGVIGVTKSAAAEYAAHGVRVNALCPGITLTAMTERHAAHDPDFLKAILPPLGRAASPDEMAEAVLWLCSDSAGFVTGHALLADGGFLAA